MSIINNFDFSFGNPIISDNNLSSSYFNSNQLDPTIPHFPDSHTDIHEPTIHSSQTLNEQSGPNDINVNDIDVINTIQNTQYNNVQSVPNTPVVSKLNSQNLYVESFSQPNNYADINHIFSIQNYQIQNVQSVPTSTTYPNSQFNNFKSVIDSNPITDINKVQTNLFPLIKSVHSVPSKDYFNVNTNVFPLTNTIQNDNAQKNKFNTPKKDKSNLDELNKISNGNNGIVSLKNNLSPNVAKNYDENNSSMNEDISKLSKISSKYDEIIKNMRILIDGINSANFNNNKLITLIFETLNEIKVQNQKHNQFNEQLIKSQDIIIKEQQKISSVISKLLSNNNNNNNNFNPHG